MNSIITGLAGSKKTYFVAETLIPQHRENLHIYFAPSIALGAQFVAMINGSVPTITINSENNPNVLSNLIRELSQRETLNEKILIVSTHQSYARLLSHHLQAWNVYIDEAIPDFSVSRIAFGVTGNVDTYFDNELLTIKAGLSNDPLDHGNLSAPLRQLIGQIGSGRYHATFSKLPDEKFNAEAIVIPSDNFWIGKTVTYIGAGVEETRVGKLLSNAHITKLQSSNSNHYSNKIKIRYYLDGANAKYTRQLSKDVIEKIIADNDSFHTGKNHIQWHNKYETAYGQSLDHNIAGSNAYQENDHATFFTSMNMPGHVVKILGEVGIDSEYLYRTITLNTAYQCLMRTNVRKVEATQGTTFTVLDSKLAFELLAFFPNATVEKVGDYEWTKTEKKVRKIRYSFCVEIGTSSYQKIRGIIKKNKEFAGKENKEVYLQLKASGRWDNYSSRGDLK